VTEGDSRFVSESRLVDLHVHSTASDGSRPPADVVAEAARIGLVAIALTDHDTIDGVDEARRAGEVHGVRVIQGVELSAVENDRETHILGLHIDASDRLRSRLEDLRGMRRRRADEMVRCLNAVGVRISIESVIEHAAGGAIGRPHVARALIGEGWATDFRDAFDRYLGTGRPGYVPKEKLPMAEAIAMIHDANGLAVAAHPGQSGTRERIESLVSHGLDGVEVRHPSHSADDIDRLGALVDFFGLVPSGGSDWHGTGENGRVLGMMRIPEDWVRRQEARLALRRERSAGLVAATPHDRR
jgi:predicted metal-dependent phosphoesterase TrpH